MADTSGIETKPTPQTVYLGKLPVNLSAISRKHTIDIGYLSRIFMGKQVPSVATAEKIASSINMSVGDFLAAIKALRSTR